MGFNTRSTDYVLGKNFAILQGDLAGATTWQSGSKVIDKGVYEVVFTYSVLKSDTTQNDNPHFWIGFGSTTSSTSGTMYGKDVLIRLGAQNAAAQQYPNQPEVRLWIEKEDDIERNLVIKETTAGATFYMYNIHMTAKKIAEIE